MDPEGILTESEDGTAAVAWVSDLSKVTPRGVGWLWQGRVPLGKVTLLVGDPGRGKSLLALDMAARISRGAPWPDALGGSAPLGRTILLSAEDDIEDTIRPRLDALGADPSRICVLRAVHWEDSPSPDAFSLSRDLNLLKAVLARWGDIKLIILDPVSAYLGGAESYNNANIRRILAPVQTMAAERSLAVVGITHLTKRRAASVIYRSMGSMAFVSASRAAWAAVPDRQAPGRMLLLPVKCNLIGGATGLAYRIVPHPSDPAQPVIAWESGSVPMTADEAMEPPPRLTPREEAAEWLKQLLAAGPLPSGEVERQAREAGFTVMTLRRAKTELGIVPYREGATWMSRLPERTDSA